MSKDKDETNKKEVYQKEPVFSRGTTKDEYKNLARKRRNHIHKKPHHYKDSSESARDREGENIALANTVLNKGISIDNLNFEGSLKNEK